MNQTTDTEAIEDGPLPEQDVLTPDETGPSPVEIRRNGALAAGVAGVAALVAAAYLARAAGTGGWSNWAVFLVMGALALAYARSWLDARTPLLVADATGIRMRLGRSWHGLPWEELEEIEHAPRQGLLRDGRLVAFPVDADAAIASLDPVARRQATVTTRVHGAPFALPLGLTTVVTGADEGLTQALLALAPDPDLVVEVVPGTEEQESFEDVWGPEESQPVEVEVPVGVGVVDEAGVEDTAVRPHPFRRAAEAARAVRDAQVARMAAARERAGDDELDDDPVGDTAVRPRPLIATDTPDPLREPSRAVRSDVTRQAPGSQVGVPVPLAEPARPSGDDTGIWRSTTVVIDDLAGPSVDPVIGPRLTSGREALGLSVNQLAERTRIRGHVIEAVEVDDFAPCGGDFYARGHLRTLARVLHLDAAPLLAVYDAQYAAAPIEARRVFEAELSTGAGGSIRSLRGGPNWSVIVAAVMAVVLAWSIARLVMDQPQDGASDTPSLSSGSAGLTSGTTDLPPAVPVVLSAQGGGARVVVRDGAGQVLFKGDLAFGQSRTVQVSPPIRVQTSDGSLTVGVDGQDPEAMGRTGRAARDTFVP